MNPSWPEVQLAVTIFLSAHPKFVPVALVAGKMWICDTDYAIPFRRTIAAQLPSLCQGAVTRRSTPGPQDPVPVNRIYAGHEIVEAVNS